MNIYVAINRNTVKMIYPHKFNKRTARFCVQ